MPCGTAFINQDEPSSIQVPNRDKRKTLQAGRNALSKKMEFLPATHQQSEKSLAGLYQAMETNLALAKHAETWEWKEVAAVH
jgi:hypothetical protein